jgi:hypothetical protein
MNAELHRLLVNLDSKFDIELDEYFNLNDEEKEQFTKAIILYFIPYAQSHPDAIQNIRMGLRIIIQEAEFNEEYEKAEIFNRCLKKYERLVFQGS